MKVLVVDDDVVARMMLMHLIDSCGRHEILEAEDGALAWTQLQQGMAPDIVFCDLRMPHMSGLDLLGHLRAHPSMARLPFVLVSAANDGATMGEALAAGADGYIVKPFRQLDVQAQFERLFEARLVADEAPGAVAARLGIDVARLRLYLDGLTRQLEVAANELEYDDAAQLQARLERLRDGCATLGLHSAVAAFASLKPGAAPDHAGAVAVLARAGAAVARQVARL